MGVPHKTKPILFVVLSVLLTFVLPAQEFRGRIQGSVVDASGGAVPNATVTLLNTETGVTATRQANEVGQYIFDLISPGNYTITVEFTGFTKFQQKSIVLQQRGDLSVNVVLKPGDIKETVTVSAEASMVQFSNAKLDTTVDSKLTNNLPQIYRTPFLLAQLDPAVEKNDGGTEFQPYHSWGPNNQRVGGGALYSNDLQVDGAAVGIGYKTGYTPSPDMVQEVNVQQNAVDAEYGNSSGSNISVTLKSGSNQWHGTAFYQGQYPWANALENRVFRTVNLGRTHMYGGTVSHPIIKNKLFNFVAYEGWKKTDPAMLLQTLPTDLERTGDFSQSLNGSGGLRTIYDPWSTLTSADGSHGHAHAVSRQQDSGCASGSCGAPLHGAIVEAQRCRHGQLPPEQLCRVPADQLPVQELLGSRRLPGDRQPAVFRPVQLVRDAGVGCQSRPDRSTSSRTAAASGTPARTRVTSRGRRAPTR